MEEITCYKKIGEWCVVADNCIMGLISLCIDKLIINELLLNFITMSKKTIFVLFTMQ